MIWSLTEWNSLYNNISHLSYCLFHLWHSFAQSWPMIHLFLRRVNKWQNNYLLTFKIIHIVTDRIQLKETQFKFDWKINVDFSITVKIKIIYNVECCGSCLSLSPVTSQGQDHCNQSQTNPKLGSLIKGAMRQAS